jgi:UDP-N-acetylglucosamine--N-acetylmuramyl-(pentapeptide) pyrophosphoryl-undecaprenol N-acetylglucosamine transferase
VSEVVIAGGGTGGHLFPGLAVAAELRRAGTDVSWLGARRGLETTRVPEAGIPLHALPVTGAAGRGPAAQLGAVSRLPTAVLLAARHLLRRKPAAVLAVGGYAALPGALAAAGLGIPLVLQEQNALPGVANRLLAPWSVAIACGFREALARFPSLPAVWTGNPVRDEFFTVPAVRLEPLTLLVLGGSQGSAFLNRVLPQAFARLAAARPLPRIVHQAGTRWEEDVRARYASLGIPAEVVGFILFPAEVLASCGLVVARSGALTVAELAAAGRAALLIPFAAAAGGHQLHNARALAATGGALVVEEPDASPERVAKVLHELLGEPEALARRGAAGAGLARRDAARAVASLTLSRGRVSPPTPHRVAEAHP